MRVLLALTLLWLAGCKTTFERRVCVSDADGGPLSAAQAVLDGRSHEADVGGVITLRRLTRPVVAVVSSPEHLARPVVVGPVEDGACVQVALLSSAANTRRVIHFGGDVMLGRRYEQPDAGYPLITPGDGGTSARSVVSDLAEAYTLANLGVLNLETVVGTLGDELAYPKKRWLLQMHPESLAAIEELGVSAIVLANNHQRDWLEEGVESTMDSLSSGGFYAVGGGATQAEAEEPLVLDVGGMRVGITAWTSVDGAYVNDRYPTIDDVPPDPLDEEDAWQWEIREWGAEAYGIAVEPRRLGDVWAIVEDLSPTLGTSDSAALWASAYASFPELQDWVARWGHGGAAMWDRQTTEAAIRDLRPHVDVLVAQFHMGMQFAEAPTDNAREAARVAIDAGADIVIAHHPHVLHGFEWYKGKLIAYSLGNLIFDQDFLATFPSGFLRTVWDPDGTLVQARFVPLWLDDYRPVPITGRAADDVMRLVWERSMMSATARRGSDDVVRSILEPGDEHTRAPVFHWEHSTAVIREGEAEPSEVVQLVPVDGYAELSPNVMVRRRLAPEPPEGIWLGRRILQTGDFEDHDTDVEEGEARGWTWDSSDVRLTTQDAAEGTTCLEMVRGPDDTGLALARPVARVDLEDHRVFADAEGGVPLDGDATYSITMQAWIDGEVDRLSARMVMYHFDDLDPTAAPESTELRSVEVEMGITEERRWERLMVDLPPSALEPVDGLTPNAALLYVQLSGTETHTTIARIDDVDVVEWRRADLEPEGYRAVDFLRSSTGPQMVMIYAIPSALLE